jgi:hypothetical protein
MCNNPHPSLQNLIILAAGLNERTYLKNKHGISNLNLIVHDSAKKFYQRELKAVETELYA